MVHLFAAEDIFETVPYYSMRKTGTPTNEEYYKHSFDGSKITRDDVATFEASVQTHRPTMQSRMAAIDAAADQSALDGLWASYISGRTNSSDLTNHLDQFFA